MEPQIIVDKKEYASVDCMKFVASLLIVALHADALYDISPLWNTLICGGLARLGVPFFFTATGFFFFRKELELETLRKYCLRMVKLYLYWFVIMLPKTIFDRIICSQYSVAGTAFRFLRSFFVTSTFSGSWFIVSCIFCSVLFYCLEKLEEKKRCYITAAIAVFSYLLGVMCSSYGALLDGFGFRKIIDWYTLLFGNPYNNIFTGIPYFALGRYFARNGDNLRSKNTYLVGGLAALACLVVEVYCSFVYKTAKATDCYFMLFPVMCGLFPLVLLWDVHFENAQFLRESSTIIFFTQFIWLFFAEVVEWMLSVRISWGAKFVFALIACLLSAVIIRKLANVKRFRWLRNLY